MQKIIDRLTIKGSTMSTYALFFRPMILIPLFVLLLGFSGCNALKGAAVGAASSAAMSAVVGNSGDDIMRDVGVGAVGGAVAGFVYGLF